MGRRTRTGILAALALVALASPAQAAIVFERDSDLWVMNDDGSGAQLLVSKASAGATAIDQPHASPAGDTLVFTGSTRSQTGPGTHCGINCRGIYAFRAGQITRLSGGPAPCTVPCSTFDTQPEATSDGRVVYEFFGCSGHPTLSCSSSVKVKPVTGGDSADWGTRCDATSPGPSPNPANPNEIVYGECFDDNSTEALYVGGPNRAGERRIACDDGAISEPAWSLDGQRIVTVETSGDAERGLWVYSAAEDACAGPGSARRVLDVPAGAFVHAPRFTGAGRIVFEADGRIYDLDPASCNPCTLGSGVRLLADNATEPAWTPSLAFAQAPQPPGGDTGGGDTGGDGGTVTDTTAPSLRSSFSRRLRLRTVFSSRGLSFRLNLGEPATVRTTVTVDRRTIRRYRLLTGRRARRARSLTIGRTTKSLAAGRRSVRVKITNKYARKLRRARSLSLKVTVTATDAAGNKRTSRKTLKLRR